MRQCLGIKGSNSLCAVNDDICIYCYCCSVVRLHLFVAPWTAARQAALSCAVSWSWLKFMSIVLVSRSNHLILCGPLLLLPSVFPSIKVFSNELALRVGFFSLALLIFCVRQIFVVWVWVYGGCSTHRKMHP